MQGVNRINKHPILTPLPKKIITFFFEGKEMQAKEGEVISTALFANDVKIFGNHYIDESPQGIFCANGQCAQCLVIADGAPVKSCVTEIKEGMSVEAIKGLPELPADDSEESFGEVSVIDIEVLIVGGGPAGLSAAKELGLSGIPVIVSDDKLELGGKLSLQTHNFFGSISDCYAGERGMDIGIRLSKDVEKLDSVEVWLNSPVVGAFADGLVGIVRDGVYTLVRPERILITAGAREKSLAFPGCDLPGVYGGGAFQTLVNRDLIKVSEKLFILGGGNVGLIGAYHAVQAGIDVLGLVEALPQCGGYKVHLDKIKRLGIPVFTSHTVVKAEGDGKLERVIISEIDGNFQPILGTERAFDVDTLLIAVGLDPVNELAKKAKKFGLNTYTAGDADIIAEASAAMFSGRIVGRQILKDIGGHLAIIPDQWNEMLGILRSKPGPVHPLSLEAPEIPRYPLIRCTQEIPCNPCSDVCPVRSISMPNGKLDERPEFHGHCVGCLRCVSICPGLSITFVDREYDPSREFALVTLPWELPEGILHPSMSVSTAGFEGETLGKGRIIAIKNSPWQDQRRLVSLEVPWDEADLVAGVKIFTDDSGLRASDYKPQPDDDVIICRCERVTKGEIRREIHAGTRDINAMKAAIRVGLGPCGGKTCMGLIYRVFREEGVDLKDVEAHIERPFTQEVPMKAFLGNGGSQGATGVKGLGATGHGEVGY